MSDTTNINEMLDGRANRYGTYASVAFDDVLIHRVLHDMGGWVGLGSKTEDEWPFVAKEFENRYRGYAMRNEREPKYFEIACRRIEDAQRVQDMFAHEVRDAYEMTAQQANLLEGVK